MRKYKIILSSKTEVLIDEDELENVMSAIDQGAMVKVRQGIINPSFVIAIVPALEYIADYKERYKYEIRDGKRPALPPALDDVFGEVIKRLKAI